MAKISYITKRRCVKNAERLDTVDLTHNRQNGQAKGQPSL